ncbi:hypothetical protein Tco_0733036 [Tanacetum coccineum]
MSFGVATLRVLVHASDKTSGDARSWYMISGDAKSWGDGRIDGQGGQVGGQGRGVNDGVDGVLDFSTINAGAAQPPRRPKAKPQDEAFFSKLSVESSFN